MVNVYVIRMQKHHSEKKKFQTVLYRVHVHDFYKLSLLLLQCILNLDDRETYFSRFRLQVYCSYSFCSWYTSSFHNPTTSSPSENIYFPSPLFKLFIQPPWYISPLVNI